MKNTLGHQRQILRLIQHRHINLIQNIKQGGFIQTLILIKNPLPSLTCRAGLCPLPTALQAGFMTQRLTHAFFQLRNIQITRQTVIFCFSRASQTRSMTGFTLIGHFVKKLIRSTGFTLSVIKKVISLTLCTTILTKLFTAEAHYKQ